MTQTDAAASPQSSAPSAPPPLVPHLVCAGAAEAIEFYRRAFGAEEQMRLPGEDGKLMHACIAINGALVFLVDENPEWGNRGPKLLGGSPVEQFWGDRYGVVEDPFGHIWALVTPVRELSMEEIREQAASAG